VDDKCIYCNSHYAPFFLRLVLVWFGLEYCVHSWLHCLEHGSYKDVEDEGGDKVEELGRRVDIQRTNITNHEKNG
jgi:hypothetical protein